MSTVSLPITTQLGAALFELAAGPVLVVDDVSWRVVASNESAEALHGGPLVGVALENLFALAGERAVERAVWRAENGPDPVELTFERHAGEPRRVRVRARRVSLEGCTVRLVALDDVTLETALATALEATRSEQRALLDALGIGLVALDSSGRVIEHNRFVPFERAFGSTLVGRNFFLDIATDASARSAFQRYQQWTHAFEEPGYHESFEFEVGRHLVEAELHAGLGVAGWDAIVRVADATDRRNAEAELRRQSFEAEEAARRTRLVYQTASLIHRSLDLEEVLETAVAETGRLLGATRCQVVFVDHEGRLDVAHEYRRSNVEAPTPFEPAVESSPTVAEAVRALHPFAVDSVDDHPIASGDALLAASESRASILAPIAVRRSARGVLAIHQADRTRRWTSGEIELAASVASQVGLAIGHVEIHERVRRQAEREAIVARLAAVVHSAESVEQALERAARALVGALAAERCIVLVGSGEDERVWAYRRDAGGGVVPEMPSADALDTLALARIGESEPAEFVVSRFVTRDGRGGVLAVERGAGLDAQALVDATAVHVGVAVGASTLLEAVTTAKQVWEGTFDAMTEGVAVHDDAFRIVRGNRAFAKLVRTKPARLVGGEFLELFSEENRTTLVEARDRVASTRRPYEFDLEERALGRLLSFSLSRLQTPEGERFIHTVRDVTDGRQMHERLAQSAKMASIGNLAAGVAHEINTPLATIAGSAQSLERQLAAMPEMRAHPRWEAVSARLEAIVEQSFRCKRITHDLLHFAAPTRPDVVSTDLARVAREAVETLERQRDVRSVAVREASAPALVATDPGLVRQVLINLVSNALDAVEGGGAVTVEVRHLARGSRVAVRDSGPGIAPEDLERVFDPFFTTKPPGKGTGLGLSISQSIVASLGGRLEARSRPSRGATFTLHLPRSARSAEA